MGKQDLELNNDLPVEIINKVIFNSNITLTYDVKKDKNINLIEKTFNFCVKKKCISFKYTNINYK
jgi:hypothetical protein